MIEPPGKPALSCYLRSRLRHVFFAADWRPVEFGTALRCLTWGAWLLITPWDVFVSSDPTYHQFRRVMSETTWGLMVGSVGILQMTALFADWRLGRRIAALLACAAWSFVCGLYLWSNAHTAAAPVHFVTSLMAAWTYVRLVRSE